MIKVRSGQVWASKHSKNEFTLNVGSNGLIHGKSKLGGIYNWNESDFHRNFKFIPQNDLEFAAVTLDKWPPRTAQIHVKGGEILGCLLHNPNAINECQWQNMRYHLGLDKKPHYRLTGGEWVEQC